MNKIKNNLLAASLLAFFVFASILFFTVPAAQATDIPLLVKSPDSNAIYFVSEKLNAKKLINSEAVFLSYGDKWEWVKIVSQATIDSYADVRLVKTENSNDVYYISKGTKRLIPSPEIFASLGFNWNEILTINQADLDSYQTESPLGAGITIASESSAADNELVVLLVDEQLATVVVPDNVWFNFTKIKFQSNSDEPIYINGLTITLYGLNNGDQQIGEIYLTDLDDESLGAKQTFRGRRATFDFSAAPLVIPAGATRTVKVWTSALLPNIYVGFGIESMDHIYTTAEVKGAFPIKSYQYRVVNRTGLAGQVKAESVKISDNLRDVVIGAENQLITKFKLTEESGQQDILVKKLILTRKGNFDDANLINIDLVDEKNKVLATAAEMKNGQIVFDLSKNPFKITAGRAATLSVRGDFVSGQYQTLQLVISSQTDLVLEGEDYGYRLLAQGTFPIGAEGASTFNKVRPILPAVSIFANYYDQTNTVVAGGKNILLGKFSVRAKGEQLEFESFQLKINRQGDYNLTDNIIIKLGGENIAEFRASDFANTFSMIGFDQDVILKENKTYEFEIYGSVDDRAANTDAYQLVVGHLNLHNANNDYFGDNLEMAGGTIRVKTLEAKISANAKYSSLAVIAGKAKQAVASFNLTVGAAENTELASVTVENTAGNYFYDKLYLRIGGRVVATLENSVSSPHIFTLAKPYKLTKGKTYLMEIYADVLPDAHGDTTSFNVIDLIITGKNSQVGANVSGLPAAGQPVLSLVSNLTISQSANGATIIAGAKNQKIATLTIANNSAEKVKIKELYVYQTADSDEFSYEAGFSNLRMIVSGGTKRLGKSVKKPLYGGNNLGGFTLNAGQTVSLDLLVDTTATAAGKTISLTAQDIIAVGLTSKESPALNLTGEIGQITVNSLE